MALSLGLDPFQRGQVTRRNGLTVAIRGGGHNVAGLASADGGLVIDLAAMNRVDVDPERRIARAQGGATLGHLDRATQAHGLAAPAGVVSATGIAGLTLGGGLGWLRRKYGLSADNLIGAEVVTADGRVLYASESEHPDLLWALRGGGGNFGVVTTFEYQLHPVGPEVAFTMVFYPLELARTVLKAHHDFLADGSDEVSSIAVLGRVPHAEFFPTEIHGVPFIAILAMHSEDAATGVEAMRPLRELGDPLFDASAVMPYLEVQQVYDEDYPDGMRYYWKSTNMAALTDEAIDVLVAHAERAPSDHSTIDIWYQGGAIARVDETATAYAGRGVPYLINPEANWEDPVNDAINIAWARALLADLERHALEGMYLNFPGFLEEGETMVRSAFGVNYPRLVDVKTQYDPENFFRMNQNIRPRE